jgi:hypothetical protein
MQVNMRSYTGKIWDFHSADVEDSGLLRCYNASPYQLLKRKLLQPFQMSGYIKVPAMRLIQKVSTVSL